MSQMYWEKELWLCADYFSDSKRRSIRQTIGLGADDYISKPFMPQELLLRIYAVLRRTYKEDSPLLVLDGCTIDFSTHIRYGQAKDKDTGKNIKGALQ